MSLIQFAVALGLYTENETHNPYFRAHLDVGAILPLTPVEVGQAWYALTNTDYGGRSPSYRAIRDPRYRFIHRCLTYTIVGRREGCEKVHQPDLFYLSNIIGKRLVNVPWRLAYWMTSGATGSRESSSLCGGQFVTRLARHFGLETEEELGTCTVVQPGMMWLSMKKLESLDMIDSDEVVGGDADSYHWLAVTPVGQELQPRAIRHAGRGARRGAGRAGAGRARNVGYGAQFDQISQQLRSMSLRQTERFDQMELMQRRQFHQTSAHLEYQDGLFEQLFGAAHLEYQPFHYQMPPEYAQPPPDQAGPSHQYQQQQQDDSDDSEYDD